MELLQGLQEHLRHPNLGAKRHPGQRATAMTKCRSLELKTHLTNPYQETKIGVGEETKKEEEAVVKARVETI